jgi:hypothetical protein
MDLRGLGDTGLTTFSPCFIFLAGGPRGDHGRGLRVSYLTGAAPGASRPFPHQAMWKESVDATANAAIFIAATQLKAARLEREGPEALGLDDGASRRIQRNS